MEKVEQTTVELISESKLLIRHHARNIYYFASISAPFPTKIFRALAQEQKTLAELESNLEKEIRFNSDNNIEDDLPYFEFDDAVIVKHSPWFGFTLVFMSILLVTSVILLYLK